MRKSKPIVKIILTLAVLTMLFPAAARAQSLSDLQKRQKDIQSNRSQVTEQYNETTEQINQIEQEIRNLDQQLSDGQDALDRISAQLEDTNQLLAKTQADLAQAEADHEAQYQLFKERLKFMYENGSYGYLEVLFQAKDFSDFLNRAEYINRIARSDKEMLEKLQAAEDLVNEKLAEVTDQKARVETLLADQTAKQDELTYTLSAKQAYLDQLDADAQTYQSKLDMLKQQDDDIKALIKKAQDDLKAQQAAAAAAKRAKAAASQASAYAGGSMSWPVPGHYLISDTFRARNNPVNGKREFHTGVDIPAPTGSAITAARGGVVIYAGWMSGYGNTVIIDSGGGVTCLYGHNSKLVVGVGQSVAEGEKIAKAGSTGNSTGPHCHFQVMVDGTAVNPKKYLNY
ncbi:MAG: peptidoglycan DD-metalloendopeptidase family protein [Firmicutes bacterium]|nr:peptidoglycan DD-metalloendopeptidase family protein [Bacillota bacterium]